MKVTTHINDYGSCNECKDEYLGLDVSLSIFTTKKKKKEKEKKRKKENEKRKNHKKKKKQEKIESKYCTVQRGFVKKHF